MFCGCILVSTVHYLFVARSFWSVHVSCSVYPHLPSVLCVLSVCLAFFWCSCASTTTSFVLTTASKVEEKVEGKAADSGIVIHSVPVSYSQIADVLRQISMTLFFRSQMC